MKDRNYLKVTGILLVIGGLFGVTAYGLLSLLLGVAIIDQAATTGSITVTAIAAAYLIAAVIQLVAGVMGIWGCNNPKKADGCYKIGIIVLIISIAAAVVNLFGTGLEPTAVISALLSLIVPGLYIYGAKLNKVAGPLG